MATVANMKKSDGSPIMRPVRGVPAPVPTPAPGKAPKGESLKQKIAKGESDLAAGQGVSMSFEEFCAK